MKGNFTHLDILLAPAKFREPPIPCGMYEVTDPYGSVHKYHFRRMPRAKKYTGRHGLFYHHPDAHWILVGVVGDEKEFNRPVDLAGEYEPFLTLFLMQKRVLKERKCSWCGHTLPIGQTDDGGTLHPECREKAFPT